MFGIDGCTFILKFFTRHKKRTKFFIKKKKNGKEVFSSTFESLFFSTPHYAKMTLKLILKIGERKKAKQKNKKNREGN